MRLRPPQHIHGAAIALRRTVTILLVAALTPLAGHQAPLAHGRAQAGSDASGSPVLRTIVVGQHPLALAVDAPANRVFVVNQGSWNQFEQSSGPASVSMLDATTGAVLHTTRLGVLHYLGSGNSIDTDAAPHIIAVDTHTRRVFVLDAGTLSSDGTFLYGPGWVYVLDATTGSLLHKVLLPPGPQAVVVDERLRRVFVGNSYDGSISTLDAATGRVLHLTTLTYGEGPLTLALDAATNRLFVTGYQALTMLDATTGQELLTTGAYGSDPYVGSEAAVLDEQARRVLAIAAVSGVETAIATNVNNVRVLIRDATTGHVLSARRLPVLSGAALAVDPVVHHAFVLTENSLRDGPYATYMLDTRTGRTLHVKSGPYPLGCPDRFALDTRIGHLYVGCESDGSGPQSISIVDTHSGRLLHSRLIGDGDPIMAVDEAINHLFITGHAGNTVDMLNASAW